MKIVLWFLALLLCCVVLASGKVQFAGVNLSGAEFGNNVPGTFNADYTYPTNSEVDYFVGKGMNVFRIPFLWERLQHSQFASFDQTEQGRLTSIINYITISKGKYVLLDPHNYARYYGQVIGQSVPVTAFADFWTKLANLFKSNSKVIFGLMNEPNSMDSNLWAADAQAAILAIRATGATNMITVPGNGYTGAWSWTPANAWYGSANSLALASITDPLNNYVFEVHQYLDSDSSGTNADCAGNNIGSQRVQSFTTWARQNGKKAILGEFGGGSSSTCLSAIDDLLNHLDSNTDVWVGWTWWSAGPWWGNYFLSIEPANGQDKPQMSSLLKHLPPSGPSSSSSSTTGRAQSTTGQPSTTGRVQSTTAAPTTAVATTGVATTGSGMSNPCTNGNNGVPTRPDSVAFSQAPFIISSTGTASLILAYSMTQTRVIVVDLMSSTPSAAWYGKGVVTVPAGSGTVAVTVTIQNPIPMGPNYMFHAWVVSSSDYSSKPDPWDYLISYTNSQVSVAPGSSLYAQDVSPCSDTSSCVAVCGSEANIDTCDCDTSGKVTVVCKGTDAVAASQSAAANLIPPTIGLLVTIVVGAQLL